MVDEDGISRSEVFDARTGVEDTPCGGVTVFDREPVTPCEGGQVQSEILRYLAAVDQHLCARAHGRGDRLDAYLAGSWRRHGLRVESSGAWGAKPEGPGLQFIPDLRCHQGIRCVRLG